MGKPQLSLGNLPAGYPRALGLHSCMGIREKALPEKVEN